MTKTMVRRIRRKMWGGRYDLRCYDDGSFRIRTDHPSNDPTVEIAMSVEIMALIREKFADAGLPLPVPSGPLRWRDDPETTP